MGRSSLVWFRLVIRFITFLVNYMAVRLLLTHNKSLFLLLVYCKPSKQTIRNICFETHCPARGHRKICLWHLVCSCLMHPSAVMWHYLHKELTFKMTPQDVSRKASHYINQNIKRFVYCRYTECEIRFQSKLFVRKKREKIIN